MADERCAKNINELIPYVYDTQRMVTIYGDDSKPVMEMINDPSNPNSDVTMGKYGITVTVGPSTVTKRQLAAEQMTSFMNAIGPSAEKYLDLLVDAQDWPQNGEWKRRAQLSLPDGFIPEDELTPEQQQARRQNQQMQQMAQQVEQANAEAEIAKKQADAALAESRAQQARASAYKAISDAKARMADVQGGLKQDEFERIMAMVDQHNSLESEDRDFESRIETPAE